MVYFFQIDGIPKIYHYSPLSNDKTVLVMELLGENLRNLYSMYKPFSTPTVMRIGLQLVSQTNYLLDDKMSVWINKSFQMDIFEHIHGKDVIHKDTKSANIAIGIKDKSRIYLFGNFKSCFLIIQKL